MTGRPGNTMSIKLRGSLFMKWSRRTGLFAVMIALTVGAAMFTGGTVPASASAQSTTAPALASTPPPTKVQANLTGWAGMSVKPRNIYFGQGGSWRLDGWGSDAEFLYSMRIGESGPPILICCHATYVEWQGGRIMTANLPVLRCEIIGGEPFEVLANDSADPKVDRDAWNAFVGAPVPVKAN